MPVSSRGLKRALNTEVPCSMLQLCSEGEVGAGMCQDYSTNVLVRWDNPFVNVYYE